MPRQNINWKNQRLDVVILHKGEHQNVELGTGLKGAGWRGGTFVTYSATTKPMGNTGKFLGVVEKHPGTGNCAGFLLFASTTAISDDPEFFSSYKPEATGVAAINRNIGKYKFFMFETMDAARRADPTHAAGADLVYHLNDSLYISSDSLLTNEAEFGLNTVKVGGCFHVPNPLVAREDYVGVDVLIV